MKRSVYFLAATVLVSIAAISFTSAQATTPGANLHALVKSHLTFSALPAGLSLLLDYQRPFKIQTLPRLRLACSTPIEARKRAGRLRPHRDQATAV